jgi:hypothetical protein
LDTFLNLEREDIIIYYPFNYLDKLVIEVHASHLLNFKANSKKNEFPCLSVCHFGCIVDIYEYKLSFAMLRIVQYVLQIDLSLLNAMQQNKIKHVFIMFL